MGLTDSVLEDLSAAVTRDSPFSNPAMWMALFNQDPGPGAGLVGEITNGTGVEARQLVTFSGSDGTDSSTAADTFTVPSGSTVTWIGFFDLQTGGAFLGGFPLVGAQQLAIGISGAATIYAPGHGRSIGDPVRCFTVPGITSSIPGGLAADTVYFVQSVTANTLTLSATDVGAAIDLISSGAFSFALDDSQTFALTGNLVFPATSGVVYETAS